MDVVEPILLDQMKTFGAGLCRPECVVTHVSGLAFASDWTDGGGVSVIGRDGAVTRILSDRGSDPLRPNGIALLPGGRFLLAHLGAETGGLYEMDAAGNVVPILTHVDGKPLPPSNFPLLDADGDLWLTVSTRKVPRASAYRMDMVDGFVVHTRNGRARIVADGLGYSNECLRSPDGSVLYVNETFARRLTAFDVHADGSLSGRRVVAEFGPGTFPDGLAMDAEGALWVTSIVSNRVIRVTPVGHQQLMLEDADPVHLAEVEAAFATGSMGRQHLDRAVGKRLANISNLAFGGTDLRQAYLGCLLGTSITQFDSPVAGLEPAHWKYDLGPLQALAV
jgi:SMP-30/Gluconolactonase/LRE-like region